MILRIGDPRLSGHDVESKSCCKMRSRSRYHLMGDRTPKQRLRRSTCYPTIKNASLRSAQLIVNWFHLCQLAYGWILRSAIGLAELLHLCQLSFDGVAAQAFRCMNGNMTLDNSAAIEAAHTSALLRCGTDARSV
jgi:hypothetical protein